MKRTTIYLVYLLIISMIIPVSSDAQLIPPSAPELILPTAASNTIHFPVHTSTYSVENVSFDMTGTGSTFMPQNLEVYSWDHANLTASGIRWVRRDPSGTIVDAGFITNAYNTTQSQVGILQDDAGNTYVLYVYNWNTMITPPIRWEAFLWTPTGLVPAIPPAVLSIYPGGRISMDCYDLRKAVVAYNEVGSAVGSLAQIGAVVFTTGATITASNHSYVAGTMTTGIFPDVSLANNGNTVRIAYLDFPSYTPPYDIFVINTDFATLETAGTGAVITYTLDDHLPGATYVDYSFPGSLFHIDCPDDYSSDIWSLVYLMDPGRVMAHTLPPGGSPVSTMISVPGAAGAYACPVVSYGLNGEIIVYGWLSSDLNRYIATQLRNDGVTFVPPVGSGVFFNICPVPPFTLLPMAGNQTYLAFSTNSNNSRLSMGYLVSDGGTPFPYYDLRSKNVSWAPATFRGEGPAPDLGELTPAVVAVTPNPFHQKVSLSVEPYNGSVMDIRMTDILGRVLLDMEKQHLHSVNERLDAISNKLSPGTYVLNVTVDGVPSSHKIIKL
ncbi:MAG: T9SS type A sorting domain-containing protein [Taibaiella sp.]|nr:T9SS type A sorting domain-containing protein [Taibaiella sp.]